ncbi:hypothetical protein Tco_0377443, partial [Tanacetum coccineum]
VVIGMDVVASGLYEDMGKTYDLNLEEEVELHGPYQVNISVELNDEIYLTITHVWKNNDESRNISCGLAISIGSGYKVVKKLGPLRTKGLKFSIPSKFHYLL